MARRDERLGRGFSGAAPGLAAPVRPPGQGALGKLRAVARHLLGLMTLRAASIAAKFALTLFIAHYLGLAPLGAYGIIVSATVLAPVLLGFGVSNHLGREAVRNGPDTIVVPLLQYLIFPIPVYVVMCGLIGLIPSEGPIWAVLLCLLLLFEHVQTDMFALMTVAGHPYEASIVFFIRYAGWAIIYMPIAVVEPDLRSLKFIELFWFVGDVLATVLAVALTSKWRWLSGVKALPRAKISLPHRHGSMALYLNDVVNTGFVYIDRYIIGIFLTHEILGVYTFFWSITNAMSNLISSSMVQTKRGEMLHVARSSSLNAFNRSLRALAVASGQMTVGLSVLAIALTYIAIRYVQRPELLKYMAILYILCGSLVFRVVYEVVGICFYAYSRDDITLYSGVVILAISLMLNIILVPVAGIWGSGVVVLASYAIGAGARGLIISRGFRRVR